jgi:hypothetical protein
MGVISSCLSSVFSSCGGPEGIKTWFLFSSGGVVCCSSFCSFLSHSAVKVVRQRTSRAMSRHSFITTVW